MLEVAEDNLYSQLVNARQHGDQMTPEQKLRIGYHIAAGVADLHSIDGNSPSVVHNDISSEQFLLVNGVYKISDFHAASFMTRDREGRNCKHEPKRMHRDVSTPMRDGVCINENLCFLIPPCSLSYYSWISQEHQKSCDIDMVIQMKRFMVTRLTFGSWDACFTTY